MVSTPILDIGRPVSDPQPGYVYTMGLELVYSCSPSPDKLVTYSDADNTTGSFAVCVGGGTVQWDSRPQPYISLPSQSIVASNVGCEVLWVHCSLKVYCSAHGSHVIFDEAHPNITHYFSPCMVFSCFQADGEICTTDAKSWVYVWP